MASEDTKEDKEALSALETEAREFDKVRGAVIALLVSLFR